jgi:ribonuclease HI
MASPGSRPYSFCKNSENNGMRGTADLNDRPGFFILSSFSIYSIDLTEEGKLGYGFTSADELEEIDIGPGDKPRPTFISRKLHPSLRELMITLLKGYADCFAWDYTEMPGLDRSIVEHRLPLKSGFRPFQQRARQMKAEVLVEVKKEVEKILEAGFIRTCRYAEWISSVVPVQKKDGRWRVCVDFRDLNRATPKDEYPMPIAETLINAAAGHKILSFMDGNAGYNQIFMAPEDIHKTTFRVPGAVGLFEYVVMTFGLKNAGATYQRAMNHIFHDLIGNLVEIYIDDVVVKSALVEGHLDDLRQVLERTRKFRLRMNPKKCAFGVSSGQFLGFLVHERGIEIGLKSQEAVRTMVPPTTKKELQQLIGKINFVRRFISNLSGQIDEFRWGAEQQRAFEEIKEYLSRPPVLVPPQQDRPFYIYLSVGDTSIASVVVQLYDGKERVVFYLSRRMLDAETRYPDMEKLCLCLFFTCTKLRHILLSSEVIIICKSDVIKHMLSAPVLKGRLGKWMFALSEFDIRYQPAKAVKGQALADLIAERVNINIAALSVRAWAMYFDGSVCGDGCGIGILLVSPRGATYSFSIRLPATCTNNLAEYEVVHKGMELLREAGAEAVEVFGDSKLVISQLTEEYMCESELLFPLWVQCQELIAQFRYINFYWIPRARNAEANDLAQLASGYKTDGSNHQVYLLDQRDWRADIFNYLKDSARGAPKRIRYKAMRYVLIGDDMFYRTLEGLLLKCLGPVESNRLLHEVHEGTCGTHQSAHKMKWLTMLEDCFKGCQAC